MEISLCKNVSPPDQQLRDSAGNALNGFTKIANDYNVACFLTFGQGQILSRLATAASSLKVFSKNDIFSENTY